MGTIVRASDSDFDMPGTPSVRVDAAAADEAMRLHASCPPEEERGDAWVAAVEAEESEAVGGSQSATPTPPPGDRVQDGQQMMKKVDGGRGRVEMLSPVSVEEKGDEKEQEAPVPRRSYAGSSPSMSYEFSNVRVSAYDVARDSCEACADECVDIAEAVVAIVVSTVR